MEGRLSSQRTRRFHSSLSCNCRGLVPEVKGLGGQLYGVIETTGPVAAQADFLEQLLAVEE